MPEPGESRKPGLYVKTEGNIDASNATVGDFQNLNKVSKRSGIDFDYDGDKQTVINLTNDSLYPIMSDRVISV